MCQSSASNGPGQDGRKTPVLRSSIILLKCDAGSDSRPPPPPPPQKEILAGMCFFLIPLFFVNRRRRRNHMFGTIVSPHMVNIVHRVFFFPFLIQNEKKKALALVAPRCVVLAIHHLHLQSQIPIDMKKKKKRRKNDGVDVLVAVTAYVFARHL
jgi:hypothetical protein